MVGDFTTDRGREVGNTANEKQNRNLGARLTEPPMANRPTDLADLLVGFVDVQ